MCVLASKSVRFKHLSQCLSYILSHEVELALGFSDVYKLV